MGLTRQIEGGWQGIVSGRMYYAPRECAQSAEAQERQAAKTIPLRLPKDCKPGSPEEALYKMQEEALSNIQRADVTDTAFAFRAFCAAHPEFANNDYNCGQLSEYLAMKGIPIVPFNGANIPLATSVDLWEEAYQWKLGMGTVQVDPSIMDAQQQLKAQREAQDAIERKRSEPTEDELYAMPREAFEKLARGLL